MFSFQTTATTTLGGARVQMTEGLKWEVERQQSGQKEGGRRGLKEVCEGGTNFPLPSRPFWLV